MVWPSAVRLVAAKLTSEVVGAALGGEGNAALSSGVTLGAVARLSVARLSVARLSVAVWPSAVLLVAVGPLVIDREMPAVVVGGDK